MKVKAFSFIIIFLIFYQYSFSQRTNLGTFKGRVVDSLIKQNLHGATISVLNAIDSLLVQYGLSKEDGSFEIDHLSNGAYIAVISFTGYKENRIQFYINSSLLQVNAGLVNLETSAGIMEEVIVHSSPILIKGDTTEFDAAHFKTIPNATAEDLLKKLPGVEVDRDGTVRTNGETVTRVFVDGKRFFGNDPKMATRNLPKEIIDKIQVIDAQSEQSQFSGFDDGERIKTINIITKRDRRKGVFGKASFAAGDQSRVANAVSANIFNNDQKISFIGQNNNINNQNFTIQDFLGVSGDGAKATTTNKGKNIFSGNAAGISTTYAGGANYDDEWGKNTDVDGNYFFNNVRSTNNRDRYRESFVANDSSLYNTNQFLSENNARNDRLEFSIDHRFDSMNSVMIRPNFSYQQTESSSESTSHTTKGISLPLNDVRSFSSSKNSGYNFNNNILLRHRFLKKGRTFSLNFSLNDNTNNRTATTVSYNNRYSRGIDTVSQISTTEKAGRLYSSVFSYTEPLNLSSQIELTYTYNYTLNNSDQQTHKLDLLTGDYNIEVPNLTNIFRNTNTSHSGGLNYRMQINPQWNYSTGIAIQHAELLSNNISKSTILRQSFNNLFPNFNIQFRKSRTANFRFSYRGSTQQPNVTQLQDVIDNSNILHIRSGNSSLKPEFVNSLSLNYNSFNRLKYQALSIAINGNFTSNKISNSVIINTSSDSLLVNGYYLMPGGQFSKPENINGAFSFNGNVTYSFPIIKQRSTLHLGGRFNYNSDVNLYNQVVNFTRNYSYSATIKLDMNLKQYLDLNLSSVSNYNVAQYSMEARQNGDYFTQHLIIEPTFTSANSWMLFNDFDCFMNRGQAAGFNQTVPLWNMGLAKLFFRQKEAELRFSVFDVLDANKSITRNVEQNYIEDVRTQVLNRYFLLSFTYHLRKFKGATRQVKVQGVKKN
jgi:hypothetical protein